MINNFSRHSRVIAATLSLVLIGLLGLNVSASGRSWDWTITGMTPTGNNNYHFTESVNFASTNWIQLKRVNTGINDYANVWAKNGYTETGGTPVEVGLASDGVSWTGSGTYYWSPNPDLAPSNNHVFGSPQRSVSVWWKSTCTLNGVGPTLVTRNTTGQSAYYSGGISIIP